MTGSDAIVTAGEMRALEAAAIARGVSGSALMEQAGAAAARSIAAFAGGAETLVLCGPGNNGGDGYVVARLLRERGWPVRVAAVGAPGAAEAIAAARAWDGPVESLESDTPPAALLVDALFGIGLSRSLDAGRVANVGRLAGAARIVVAIDLPSGVATDSGAVLSEPPQAELTVTFGALKPAHVLQPAARYAGRIVVAEIGLAPERSDCWRVGTPALPPLAADVHKFARGHVVVIGGEGAARLTARAAQRAGSGYVTLAGERTAGLDSVVVRADPDLRDVRIGAIAVGPGLGSQTGHARVAAALASGKPVVLDADVFTLFAGRPEAFRTGGPAVLTPHEGEFRRLFGDLPGSKIDRVRAAAGRAGGVVLLKGPDTVIADPDGRVAICTHGTPDLATAGSGDVLTGVIAALLARGLPPFEAACAGAWLHAEAGERAGPGLIAEDLIDRLAAVVADCS